MCLCIDEDSAQQKRRARKEGKEIIAYKILQVRKNRLYAPWMGTRWLKTKSMVSDREGKDPTRLTKEEGQNGEIDKGLHFCMNLGKASRHRLYMNCTTSIYKVKIDPRDIIAFGYGDIVAHKAKIIGLER